MKKETIIWCPKCGKIKVLNFGYPQCPLCGAAVDEEKAKDK